MRAGRVDGGTRLEEVGDGFGRVEDDDGFVEDADGDEVTCRCKEVNGRTVTADSVRTMYTPPLRKLQPLLAFRELEEVANERSRLWTRRETARCTRPPCNEGEKDEERDKREAVQGA